jgi:hypothetical protein
MKRWKELTNPGNFAARKPPFSRQINALADKNPMIRTTGGYDRQMRCAIAHGSCP